MESILTFAASRDGGCLRVALALPQMVWIDETGLDMRRGHEFESSKAFAIIEIRKSSGLDMSSSWKPAIHGGSDDTGP